MKDKCAKVNTLQLMESMISFDRKRMSKGAAACMVMCVLVVFSGAIMSWCSFTLTLTLCSVLMLLCGSVGINLVSWKATKGFSKEEARMFRKLVAAELECILSESEDNVYVDLEKASLKDVKLLWSQCIQYRLSQGPTTFRLPSIRDWSKYDKESQALFGLLFRMRYLSSRKVCLTEDEISVHGEAGVQYPALFNRKLWIPVCNAESSYDDTFGRLLIDYINSGKYDKEFFKKTFLFKNGYIVDIADKGFALSLLAHMNI